MTTASELSDLPRLEASFAQWRALRSDRLGALDRFNREVGDIGRVPGLFNNVLLANSPELVHEVLVSKARSFHKSPVLRTALYPLVGEGLFTSDGELWRRQRKTMAPIFQHAQLRGFATSMTECAERVAAGWKDGQTVDMARETTHLAMAIAGRTLFDADTFEEADELAHALTVALDWAGDQTASIPLILQARVQTWLEIAAAGAPAPVSGLFAGLARRLLPPLMIPGAATRELRRALVVLEQRVARMIEERRSASTPRHDLLSLLLSAVDEDGARMSDRQVRDEVLTLFVAGHETTANALAWSLMLLSQHPDVYASVRAEVAAVGRVPTFDDLPRLALAGRVFKEALRLYPPVYLFGRQVEAPEVEIGGYRMPKGTIVLISPYALHRRPDVWPEPDLFQPDRFLPEAEARRHKCAFLPFSAGPRTCIGNHFALMEGPLVLATLLRRADVQLVSPGGSAPEPLATLRPRRGMPMRVTLRAD